MGIFNRKDMLGSMRYVKECAVIFGITLIGELLNRMLPLLVPTGVYGLFLLLVCLCTVILKLDQVEAAGNFLLDIMPMLFIPAAVGLMENYDSLRPIVVPVLVICLVSTVIVMAVTGKVTELMMEGRKKKGGGDS